MSRQRRQQAREAIAEFNRMRRFRPKCGARAKSTGQPCEQMAMANGKCHLHGGRTPSGNRWHRLARADGKGPKAGAKFVRKLRDQERRAKDKRLRLKRMSDEERAAHEAWQKAHKPGPPGPRAAERDRRKQNVWVRDLLERKAAEERERAIQSPPVAGDISCQSVGELDRDYLSGSPNAGLFE